MAEDVFRTDSCLLFVFFWGVGGGGCGYVAISFFHCKSCFQYSFSLSSIPCRVTDQKLVPLEECDSRHIGLNSLCSADPVRFIFYSLMADFYRFDLALYNKIHIVIGVLLHFLARKDLIVFFQYLVPVFQ